MQAMQEMQAFEPESQKKIIKSNKTEKRSKHRLHAENKEGQST
jgi:hypothetical protein